VPSRLIPSSANPFPITPRKWYFRNSIDYSVSLNYAVLNYAVRNRDELLFNIYRMGKNSIEKGERDNWTLYPKRSDEIAELYKKEQDGIIDKIISILDLENKNTYTLYELDKNEELQKQIMELIPEIRKWFAFNNMKAVGEPERIKRPWLSIVKNLLKSKYTIENKEQQFKINEKWIKSPIYIFTKV
jgi:hypothetical protein